jgi:cytosine deaminase
MVVLQATDPIEAIRLKAHRLFVIRNGAVIAEAPPAEIQLTLGDTRRTVDFGATRARGPIGERQIAAR